MRDDTSFVERLRRDLSDVRWPEPAEIRARARRRSRRTAAAAAAVVFLVAGVAVGVGDRLRPAPASEAASTGGEPGRYEVPTAALLQPADLPAPAAPPMVEAGLGERVRVDVRLEACLENRGTRPEWVESRYSRSQTLLRARPAGAVPQPRDVLLTQDLYRVHPAAAPGIVDDLARRLTPCVAWQRHGQTDRQGRVVEEAGATHGWHVVERDFAGSQAAMLRHTVSSPRHLVTGREVGGAPAPTSTAVVRVGDLVTVFSLGDGGSEAELRRLATVAATRMCAVANPRC
ncbi:hypothetical protein GA0070606_2375 [Micromonospora citrea]|uniref:PknH-like extracellular domain-containing protein n=1 Tax=Micromonospora citrea TaxID=47855 RepID=A0A1C6UM44_9ACTN|nr:hypothetical protein [Micromonospora citrea]SCL55002.1 hypothetical protein GA0070606_2375 [Micromonospora citrea]